MQWVILCYAYCQESVCYWLFGTPEECSLTSGDRQMGLEWYFCYRCRADKHGTQTLVSVLEDPIDAVLARDEHHAEAIAESRHGFRPNEWIRAKACESRWDEKFAAILNDTVTVRIAEFRRFMTLESKRVSKES